jgi:hypothetical protein
MRCFRSYPTPYPDVNDVLDLLLSSVQTTLGDHFVGMYLYGSLASGDFDPHRSDIDFVVVTAGELPQDRIAALETMHTRLAASGLKWAAKLEGAYVPRHAIRRHDQTPCPNFNEGRFQVSPLGSDWVIQRHVMREQGAALVGPAPHTLIDPVAPDDLRRAIRDVLVEWWAPMIDDPAWLYGRSEYQAFAVLTMCRALYTLHHGDISSKPVAARWAQAALGEPWSAVIDWALHDAQSDHLNETLDFLRYTLARSREFD